MRLRTTCSAAFVGLTLLVGLAAVPATAAAPRPAASGSAHLLDACPAPTSTSDSNYHPSTPGSLGHVDSITFSGSGASRSADIIASGFIPDDGVDLVNWTLSCAGEAGPGQVRADSQGIVSIEYPVVPGVVNYFHFDHSNATNGGETLAFFADDSGGGGTTPPVAPGTVGTPILSKTTVSGTGTRTARFELTAGHEGDTVFAVDGQGATASPTVTFSASGTATVDLPVTPNGITPVEFHVFPKGGQGTIAFVFSAAVNETASSDYAFRVAGIEFTDSPRTAHVTLDGLLPNTAVDVTGGAASAAATVADTGRAIVDVPLRAGLNTLQVAHTGPTGPASFLLQLDSAQQSTATPPAPPAPTKPAAPTVTTTSAGQGLTRLTIRGTGTAATVRNTDGRVIASTPLDGASGFVVIPTPTSERHYSVTQTVAAVESRAADVVLSAGSGNTKPAPPVVHGKDAAEFFYITFSVTGTPGATVKVYSEGSEHRLIAVKAIGASGTVDVPRLFRSQAGNGGALEQSAFVTQTVDGATSDPGYDLDNPLP